MELVVECAECAVPTAAVGLELVVECAKGADPIGVIELEEIVKEDVVVRFAL